MSRRLALRTLGLKEGATAQEAKQQRKELLKQATIIGDGEEIQLIHDAYKMFCETVGEAATTATKYIAHDSHENPPEQQTHIQRVPPYEEAVIGARISLLPRRVALLCILTGSRFSAELRFNKQKNSFSLRNPIPATNEPLITDIVLPVLGKEISFTGEISTPSGDHNEQAGKLLQHYRDQAISDEIAVLHQQYSRATRFNDSYTIPPTENPSRQFNEKYNNDPDFGHDAACCHCGLGRLKQCKCGGVFCSPTTQEWPAQWPNQDIYELPCPYCSDLAVFCHPDYLARRVAYGNAELKRLGGHVSQPPIKTRTSVRKTDGGIDREKYDAVAHDPVKRIAKM